MGLRERRRSTRRIVPLLVCRHRQGDRLAHQVLGQPLRADLGELNAAATQLGDAEGEAEAAWRLGGSNRSAGRRRQCGRPGKAIGRARPSARLRPGGFRRSGPRRAAPARVSAIMGPAAREGSRRARLDDVLVVGRARPAMQDDRGAHLRVILSCPRRRRAGRGRADPRGRRKHGRVPPCGRSRATGAPRAARRSPRARA
jgi:hypothetical protein